MTLLDPLPARAYSIDHRSIDHGSIDSDVTWVGACALDDLVPDRGVCAWIAGAPVALFRCWPDDELYAVGNIDPFSGASVLSRGLVGSIGDRPVVASPIFKQRFDLRTGEALDDHAIRLPVHPVRVRDGQVEVGAGPLAPEGPT